MESFLVQGRVIVVENAPDWGKGITRTVRSAGIASKSQIKLVQVHNNDPFPNLNKGDFVVVSGGEMGVGDLGKGEFSNWNRVLEFINKSIQTRTPVMAHCLGHQFVGYIMGSLVVKEPERREIGYPNILLNSDCRDILGFDQKYLRVFSYHNDHINDMPDNGILLGTTLNSPFQVVLYPRENILTTQFHPEMDAYMAKHLFNRDKDYLKSVGLSSDELVKESKSIDDCGRLDFYRCAVRCLQSRR